MNRLVPLTRKYQVQSRKNRYFFVPLHYWNHISLVDQLLVFHPAAVASGQALDVVENCLDALLASFLNTPDCTGPEEHLGVSEPPLVVHGLDRGKDDGSTLLQIWLGCVHLLRHDDEPVDKVGVDRPVGEAPATNPDALEHTVAGKLVHHKGGVEEKWRL